MEMIRNNRIKRSYKYASLKMFYFICIKDFNAETNTSLKFKLFSFFICGCQHHQRKTICLYVYISDIRQIVGFMSIPTTFRLFLVLTSQQIGRRLPVFTILLWQRQHIIVVDAVDYKYFSIPSKFCYFRPPDHVISMD
jgi:hypothetical protein